MNQAIKSHWKLAYRCLVKAIKVTFQTIRAMHRAKIYTTNASIEILKQRAVYKKLESISENVIVTKF